MISPRLILVLHNLRFERLLISMRHGQERAGVDQGGNQLSFTSEQLERARKAGPSVVCLNRQHHLVRAATIEFQVGRLGAIRRTRRQ